MNTQERLDLLKKACYKLPDDEHEEVQKLLIGATKLFLSLGFLAGAIGGTAIGSFLAWLIMT